MSEIGLTIEKFAPKPKEGALHFHTNSEISGATESLETEFRVSQWEFRKNNQAIKPTK